MAGVKGRSGRKAGPKTLEDIYGIYRTEYSKVQQQYKQFIKELNRAQVEQEVKAEPSIWNKKGQIKSTVATKYAKSLVKSGYTWTKRRVSAVERNINDYIAKTWLESTGRKSVQGRTGQLNMQQVQGATEQAVLNIMITFKGANQQLTTYKITEQDVLNNSAYYVELVNALKVSGIAGDDIYGS